MIITFPMLVSQSVSENAIPGIAKTIESYIILKHMNDIMDNVEVRKRHRLKGFKTTKKGWFARESVDLSEADRPDLFGPGQGKGQDTATSYEDRVRNAASDVEKERKALKAIEDKVASIVTDIYNKEKV